MLKRPQYIVLGLVVLLTLVVLNLPAQTAIRLKLAVGGLFLPLFGLAGAGQQTAAKATDAILPRAELARQNESLRRENQQLRLQAMQAEETARENDRLRQLFQWQQQSRWKTRLKLARVILRDPANWWRTVQIDLGSRDGVRTNVTVLTTDGLVGRVNSVSLTRSQVVLIGDPNCKVAALVENETRDTGVIGAGGPFDNSLVELSYLSRRTNLKPGQNVVTSGLGEIFPAGIPIGKIVDSRPVEYGLYTEARVKLAANLSGLEEVWVLLP
ncbi:MAG: rod shape-determining protein MreC [Verrucomicrobia bacterium]|jgi:rod shape-determining protein MreC|nr:rod shape-determining protein MreC [Verrucomicrobiota bacterium]